MSKKREEYNEGRVKRGMSKRNKECTYSKDGQKEEEQGIIVTNYNIMTKVFTF